MKVSYIEATNKLESAFKIIENRLEEVDQKNEEYTILFKIQDSLKIVEQFLKRIKAPEKLQLNMKTKKFVSLLESVLNKIDQMDSSGLKDIKTNLESVKSFLHDYWVLQNEN